MRRTTPSAPVARRRLAAALGVALASVLVSTAAPPAVPSGAVSGAVSGGADPADDPVRRVVAISVDGLAPAAIRTLGRAGTPSLHRMIARGASTLNARTLRESTSTLPSHTGMVTGRRVTVAAGGHGVGFNSDNGSTVHAAAGEYVASVFSVVHDRCGSTAMYAGKSKFAFLDRSWNRTHGARDRVGADQGRDKIDRYVYTEGADALVTRLVRQLRRNPATFSFLHLRLPDSAGHGSGFQSRRYLRAVRRSDALVGRVLATIRRRPALRRHTAVVLTADHGGTAGSRSHSDPRLPGNFRVPFLVWGTTVAHGADLYRLNGERRRPGDRRTTYRGRQPVRNAELANLAADLLDLPAVPGSRINARHTLDVRRR